MTTFLVRAALARRILIAAGLAGSAATFGCGDDASGTGGSGATSATGADGPGGASQGGAGDGGIATDGGGGSGGDGGAAVGGEGQGGSVDGGGGAGGEMGIPGRPLMVHQVAERATIRHGKTWRAGAAPCVGGLAEGERARLAEVYARDAAYEHASIASFAKFSLELLALGAPAELVSAAHEAALDEIKHASLLFALASAYRDQLLEPGPLPAVARITLSECPRDVAAALVVEGCVGETLASLVAMGQHAVATDAAVRAALGRIAEDEARHAELAWRSLAWIVKTFGEPARTSARVAFGSAIEAERALQPSDATALHAHGRLSSVEERAERARGLRDIVIPSARALLGEPW